MFLVCFIYILLHGICFYSPCSYLESVYLVIFRFFWRQCIASHDYKLCRYDHFDSIKVEGLSDPFETPVFLFHVQLLTNGPRKRPQPRRENLDDLFDQQRWNILFNL